MTITRSIMVSQLAFRNKNYVPLLLEIAKYFEERPNRENYLEDTVIVFDHETGSYIATIYINDVMED